MGLGPEEGSALAAHFAGLPRLSESYFKQKFRQEMSVPPAKYIMQRRIALSRRLLAEGVSVAETTFRLEFSSSQHFAAYFKAYTLMTPSEWKRVYGTSAPDDVYSRTFAFR